MKQNSYMHTAICTCDLTTSCHGSNDEVDLDLMVRAKGAINKKKKGENVISLPRYSYKGNASLPQGLNPTMSVPVCMQS